MGAAVYYSVLIPVTLLLDFSSIAVLTRKAYFQEMKWQDLLEHRTFVVPPLICEKNSQDLELRWKLYRLNEKCAKPGIHVYRRQRTAGAYFSRQ